MLQLLRPQREAKLDKTSAAVIVLRLAGEYGVNH